MKQIMLAGIALLFFCSLTSAQEMDIKKERKRIKTEQRHFKQLNLNDQQGQQLQAINRYYRTAHQRIMQNDGLTQQQKQDQIQALNKKRVADIHAVIGKDNIQAYDRIRENEKKKLYLKKEKKNKLQEKKNKKG